MSDERWTIPALLRTALKLLLVAAIAGFVIYRVRFAPVSVQAHRVEEAPIVSEVLGTGTLEARVQATISPKISGRLTELLADQGDRVTKGQLLATLDDGELRQQVEMARADVAATRAGVDRAAADIARAEATAVQARASYTRNQHLAQQKLLSEEEFDKATQQRDVAEAELRRSQLAKVEAERHVVKAEEALRYYQERLADTRILAPFDGLVVRRSREPGDVVVPGSTILQLISTSQMWVSAWVDESAMPALAVGQPARVVFRSEPDQPWRGTVTRLSPLADRETREFLVDVTVSDLPAAWAVGQRAEVYIQANQKDSALVVPQQAVLWRDGHPGLFIRDPAGHARWRNVTVGLRGAQTIEISQGLVAGELVIWPDNPKTATIREGRAVAPRQVTSP